MPMGRAKGLNRLLLPSISLLLMLYNLNWVLKSEKKTMYNNNNIVQVGIMLVETGEKMFCVSPDTGKQSGNILTPVQMYQGWC